MAKRLQVEKKELSEASVWMFIVAAVFIILGGWRLHDYLASGVTSLRGYLLYGRDALISTVVPPAVGIMLFGAGVYYRIRLRRLRRRRR